ncbi:MAG: acyl carrier protein [Bacteroidetes bacterium]|nr:acyl carrier protein [Bacteroidota bacterium]
MERTEVLKTIKLIMEDVFDVSPLVINELTSAADIEEWDSLNHVQLVVTIEKHFKIKFTAKEIRTWVNVGEMCSSILNRQ